MCQRAFGNAFAALAPVRRADLAWTQGTPSFFASSTVAERGFCSICGAPPSFAYGDSDWSDLTIGSFDRPDLVPPSRHLGTESQMPWLHLADDWPRSETQTTFDPRRQQAVVSNQA